LFSIKKCWGKGFVLTNCDWLFSIDASVKIESSIILILIFLFYSCSTNIMKNKSLIFILLLFVHVGNAQTFEIEEQNMIVPCTTGIWQVLDSSGSILVFGSFKPGITPSNGTCYSGIPHSVVFNSTVCTPSMVTVIVGGPAGLADCTCASTSSTQKVQYIANSKPPNGTCTMLLSIIY
jgi:hypothetical protein